MKKTTFRVKLFEGSTSLCNDLVLLAAKSNGSNQKLSLNDLKTVAKGQQLQYPTLNRDTTVEQIGEHLLHIDIKDGEDYKTIAVIEEIEVFEIPTPEFEEKPYLHEQTNWD